MSDYSPTPNYPWTTGSPDIDSENEETKDLTGVPSGAGIRNYQTSYPEPYSTRTSQLLVDNMTRLW